MRIARLASLVVLGGLAALVLTSSEYRPIFLSGAGIAQGALIAAIALGVLLTYRGSGVVNLANGAIAMYAAYVYTTLRTDGDLFLPPIPNPLALVELVVHRFQGTPTLDLPDLPTSVSLGPNLTFGAALVLALACSALLGVALHLLVYRPLRSAPPLAKVVASVGVLLYLQAVILRRFSTAPQAVKSMPFVDKSSIDLGVTTMSEEQLLVTAFVVVAAAVLWLLYARTRFGLATRAAAENEKGALALGISPDRVAGVNWVLSTVVTGLLGILVASINSNVDPFVIPALIVPALTAALVGGFRSFGLTTIAAFLLGMQLPLITALGAREDWFPKAGTLAIPGVEMLVPFVVIGAVLFLRGNALPGRGSVGAVRLPTTPTPGRLSMWAVGPALALAVAAFAAFGASPAYRTALSNSLIGVIVCLSVVVITGYVGQISLAPLTFAGVSAFTVSRLSSHHGWPLPWSVLAGAAVAAAVGLLVAIPTLRIRGVNLAIVTLAFALTADRFLFDNEDVNGGLDRALVDSPGWLFDGRAATYDLAGVVTVGDGMQPNPVTTLVCLLVAVTLCYAVANLRRSATGREMLAVRSNERAAAAAGVDVAGVKALAFAVAAFIGGLGGAVIAYRTGQANQERFTYTQSLVFFAFAYLGGVSRVSGAIVGGALVTGGVAWVLLDDLVGTAPELTLLVGGVGLVVTSIVSPEGIAGRVGARLARPPRRPPAVGTTR